MKAKIILIYAAVLLLSFFLDNPVMLLMGAIKNPVFDTVMEWFSHEITVFFVLVIVSAVFMYEERKKNYIPVVFGSFLSGLFISQILKLVFMRVRPIGLDSFVFQLGSIFKIAIPD